jgi:hypothetical protein
MRALTVGEGKEEEQGGKEIATKEKRMIKREIAEKDKNTVHTHTHTHTHTHIDAHIDAPAQ